MIQKKLSAEFIIKVGLAGVWEKREQALKRRLVRNPDEITALDALGTIYRQKGDLLAAGDIYGRLSMLHPAHSTATYLHAVLTDSTLPLKTALVSPTPAPFVQLPNFLPQEQRDRLFELARTDQQKFEALNVSRPAADKSGTFVGQYDPKFRQQLGLLDIREVDEMIKPRVLSLLPTLLPRLRVKPFSIGKIGTQLALSHHGHFGKAHTDDRDGQNKVTFVYYFHKQPKAFSGGNLLLYDTHIEKKDFNPSQFTQLIHQDNTLVLYPSAYYHEITQVHCPSHAFDDGRFAVAGHIGVA